MKNQKDLGLALSEQEMKNIKGGYVFPISEMQHSRCPSCGKRIYPNTYTYYITCEYCGSIIPIEEEKENDASK